MDESFCREYADIMQINLGDINLEARWRWQGTATAVSPFINFCCFRCAIWLLLYNLTPKQYLTDFRTSIQSQNLAGQYSYRRGTSVGVIYVIQLMWSRPQWDNVVYCIRNTVYRRSTFRMCMTLFTLLGQLLVQLGCISVQPTLLTDNLLL